MFFESIGCRLSPFHLRFSGQDAANQSHLLCSPPGEVWQHLAGVAYEFHTLQLKAPTTQTSFYIYSWLICISFICIMNQSCVFLLFLITHLVGIVCSCYVFFLIVNLGYLVEYLSCRWKLSVPVMAILINQSIEKTVWGRGFVNSSTEST